MQQHGGADADNETVHGGNDRLVGGGGPCRKRLTCRSAGPAPAEMAAKSTRSLPAVKQSLELRSSTQRIAMSSWAALQTVGERTVHRVGQRVFLSGRLSVRVRIGPSTAVVTCSVMANFLLVAWRKDSGAICRRLVLRFQTATSLTWASGLPHATLPATRYCLLAGSPFALQNLPMPKSSPSLARIEPPALPQTVATKLAEYPPVIRQRVLALREIVFMVAAKTPGVGPLEESLKWGEPAFATVDKSGQHHAHRVAAEAAVAIRDVFQLSDHAGRFVQDDVPDRVSLRGQPRAGV